jgi:hypothetical protein
VLTIKLEKTEETLKNEQCRDNLNNGLKRHKLKRNNNKATHTSQHRMLKIRTQVVAKGKLFLYIWDPRRVTNTYSIMMDILFEVTCYRKCKIQVFVDSHFLRMLVSYSDQNRFLCSYMRTFSFTLYPRTVLWKSQPICCNRKRWNSNEMLS